MPNRACISKKKRAGLVLKPPELTSRNTAQNSSYSLWISRQASCGQFPLPVLRPLGPEHCGRSPICCLSLVRLGLASAPHLE